MICYVAGDWRQAVDFRVTEAELKLQKSAETLKRADQQLKATVEASKPRKIVPKSATRTQQQRAAVFKVRSQTKKVMKAQRPAKTIFRGNSKTGFTLARRR